jgi:hypothetical protein
MLDSSVSEAARQQTIVRSIRSNLLSAAIAILNPKPRRLRHSDNIPDDLGRKRASGGTYMTQAPQGFEAGRIRQSRHIQHGRPASPDIADAARFHFCQQALCTAVSRQIYRHTRAQADQGCRQSGEVVRDLAAKQFGGGGFCCREVSFQFYDGAF